MLILAWEMMVLFGGLGGLIATIAVEQVEQRSKTKTDVAVTQWVKALLLNIVGGSVVSFLLWGTYTNDITLSSAKFTPAQLVASLLAGFGGVGGVRSYLRGSAEAKKAEQAEQGRESAEQGRSQVADSTEVLAQAVRRLLDELDQRHRKVIP